MNDEKEIKGRLFLIHTMISKQLGMLNLLKDENTLTNIDYLKVKKSLLIFGRMFYVKTKHVFTHKDLHKADKHYNINFDVKNK